MGFEKRVSAETKLVSLFDDAYVTGFTDEQRESYEGTLDIGKLGDITGKDKKPAVFVCKPLMPKYEYLAFDAFPDYWGIFKTHVVSIEGGPFEVVRENEQIVDTQRGDFPTRIVQDIASQIVALCNKSGGDYFFTPSGAAQHYAQAVKARLAVKQMMKSANTAAAIIKNTL